MRTKQLIQKRVDIVDRMKAILAGADSQGRRLTEAENAKWNELNAETATLAEQIEKYERIEAEERHLSAMPEDTLQPRLWSSIGHEDDPHNPNSQPSRSYTGRGERWIDRASGRPVRVLAPSEPVGPHTDVGFDLADMIRAMTVGPRSPREMLAMDGITRGAGGALIPAPLSNVVVDAMRAKACAVKLGARTIVMDNRTLDIARIVTDPTIRWREEGAAVAQSTVGFDRIQLEARSLSFLVLVTRELLEDAQNLNQELLGLFSRVIATGVDAAVLAGRGIDDSPTTSQPRGVLETSGMNEIATPGALKNYDVFIDIASKILEQNGDLPDAYAIDPESWGVLSKLKQAQTLATLEPPPMVANMRSAVTTALLGTSSPQEGNIVVGNFGEILIGMRTPLEVTLLKERFVPDSGSYAFWVWTRIDSAVVRPKNMGRIVHIG